MLTVATLLTVLVTAALVYVPWHYTATRNIDDTVQALDRQISQQVTTEIEQLLGDARATVEALRTVLFQRVVSATDAAKREFLFLAHLQSQDSVAWVSFGFPNGDFFGAHKPPDGGVQMVETNWDAKSREATLRIDHYEAADGDIWFQMRDQGMSQIYAPELPWFQLAVDKSGDMEAVWTDIHALPLTGEPGITAAVELRLFDAPVGVVSVSVALKRISDFLNTLQVGPSGSVYVVDGNGAVVAAKTNTTAGTDAGIVRLQTALASMANRGLQLDALGGHQQWRATDVNDAGYFIGATPLNAINWVVITVIPDADFLNGIEENNRQLLMLLLGFIAVVALLATVTYRRVVDRPLSSLVRQFRRIGALELDEVRAVSSPIREFDYLSSALLQMTRGLSGFTRYLPTELIQALIARGTEDSPERREATIFYLDLQSFTRIGEGATPEQLVTLLNEFFTVANRHIVGNGGAVLQFQGDAILAAFNVPADHAQHARAAVMTATGILAELETTRFTGDIELRVRIGINTGQVVAGTVGSAARANYTIHGDAVNLAARLESMNKQFGTCLLVTEDTIAHLDGEFAHERIGEVEVRGKTESVIIYTLG
ncbi:MAG: adenylate/guanylate cyclase domain-containing protein [Pseudomonadota bacterium]